MPPFAAKGYPECASCINKEFDPFRCCKCNNADKWEGVNDDDTPSVHDMGAIRFQQEESE